jgi:hypothetical protein
MGFIRKEAKEIPTPFQGDPPQDEKLTPWQKVIEEGRRGFPMGRFSAERQPGDESQPEFPTVERIIADLDKSNRDEGLGDVDLLPVTDKVTYQPPPGLEIPGDLRDGRDRDFELYQIWYRIGGNHYVMVTFLRSRETQEAFMFPGDAFSHANWMILRQRHFAQFSSEYQPLPIAQDSPLP